MEYIINGYEPAAMFGFFEDIAAIPHGSGNEKALADYIQSFAEKRGLFCIRDEADNLLIKKPAGKSAVSDEPVMLQGHTDMVCEKEPGCTHDFERDPLKLRVDNGILSAEGTTLGADNAVSVALMLALLDSDDEELPPLECLFTSAEETGMNGACCFDYSNVSAKKLINLDSDNLATATAGCAGGIRLEFEWECDTVPAQNKAVRIKIGGLGGGHSGVEIDKDLCNANTLMVRLLYRIYHDHPINLVSLSGGGRDNVITRECEAVIRTDERERAISVIENFKNEIRGELVKADRHFSLRTSKCTADEDNMLTCRATSRLLSALIIFPNGVYKTSRYIKGFPEISANTGSLVLKDGKAEAVVLARAMSERGIDTVTAVFAEAAKLTGGKMKCAGRYPCWEYKPDTDLQKCYRKAYAELFGGEANVTAIHAGLECGIIKQHLPGLDAIALGPTIKSEHTPRETLDLASYEKLWKLVNKMLKTAK